MSTFDPAAFDRWLTTQPDDSMERGKLEDDLREKIESMFFGVNVTLPEHVLATAVTYAADLAEAYVTEVTATCERCGRPIDEDNSAKDRQDTTIWVCAGGYGCDSEEERLKVYTVEPTHMDVPADLLALLVAGLQRLVMRDNKRIRKGKAPLLSAYERTLIEDGVDMALLDGFTLYYEVR